MNEPTEFRFDDVDNSLNLDSPAELPKKPVAKKKPAAKKTAAKKNPEVEAPKEPANKAELLTIYDAIMFEDKFEKAYPLGTKYSAVFSSRVAENDISIARQLDVLKFDTMHAMQTMTAILTLSHGLIELNGKDLREMTPTERYDYIRNRPTQLVGVLAAKQIEFDSLVSEALEYGSENF